MGELSLSRYEIRGVLGRGGTGVVYEAYDSRAQSVVALKTLESAAPENLFRLKHEFRALADVQHHNLVRFGELSYEDGTWFFTMELVRGTNFIEYVRPFDFPPPRRSRDPGAPPNDAITETVSSARADSGVIEKAVGEGSLPNRFDEGRLRAALAQLVSALGAIHDAGHVHRDVKPSNVLVTEQGRVVLLDFGLVTALVPQGQMAHDSWVLGTPAFMAPEQAEGHAVGPEADWYSVGVMIYLAITGRLPFPGSGTEMLTAKLSHEAPAAHLLAPDVPHDLDALAADLLRMSPAERPKVDEIRARLGVAAPSSSATLAAADATSPFIGREAELALLEQARDDVERGDGPRVIVVLGEPGMGKSTFVQRFLSELGPDVLVMSGRCYEQETVPWKGIDTIVDALSEHLVALDDDEVEAIVGGGVRYLATVFPVLGRVPVIRAAMSGAREVVNPSALREQAFGELQRVVTALAERATLVLFLDDLQWADKDSLSLLDHMMRGADAPRCLFIATMRSGVDLPADAALFAKGATRIALGGLSDTESRALLDSLWTQSSRLASAKDRDLLMREAEGHPLFLAELVRSARAGETRHEARTSLEEVLWSRVQQRDAIDRRFLEILAIAGAPMPFDVIATAAENDVGECQTRLGSLRAAQLIRVSRRGDERLVEPYHDRIRESILLHRREDQAGLAAPHLRLGRALLARTPAEALGARVFSIVQHMNAAGDAIVAPDERRRVAELNLLASREAQLAAAYERARDYAKVGLTFLGPSAWRDAYALARDLHVERMSAELLAGDVDAAKGCFEASRAQITASADRTELYVAWIELEASRGHFNAAIAAGRDRLRELGMPLPSRVSIMTLLLQYLATRRAQGRRSIDELLHLAPLADEAIDGAMKILVTLAPAAFFVETNLVAWIALRLADLSMRHGVSDVSSYGFASYGLVLTGAFGKHAEGDAFGRLALALNERMKNEKLTAKIQQICGTFLVGWVRPFADGKALLEASYEGARSHGETAYEAYGACGLSFLSFLESSDLASLQSTAAWARDVCERRKDRNMAGSAEAHMRYAATLRAREAGPRDLAHAGSSDDDFRASLGDALTAPGAFYAYWSCNAELAYLFGDIARASLSVREAGKLAQANFGNPATVDFCFLECLVAARAHDTARGGKRLTLRASIARRVRKLRTWAQSCPVNFEPHYLIASAELARVRGDARGADVFFERAITAARAHHSTKREAIALELAAAHARARGDVEKGTRLLREAEGAYRRWGAVAKADVLALALTPPRLGSGSGDVARA